MEKEVKIKIFCQCLAMFSNDFKPKLSPEYFCEKCDYKTGKKSNMDNHCLSAKHIKSMISNDFKPGLSSKYTCQNCHKEYKDNSELWRHNKKCCVIETNDEPEIRNINSATDKDEMINYLIKENQEFKNMIIKIIKREPL